MSVATVLGAGPAAWTVAIGLRQRGWDVTVFGRPALQSRNELVVASALLVLERMKVPPNHLRAVSTRCPGSVSRWSSPVPVARDAVIDPHGASWSLDRAQLSELLRQHALAAGVRQVPLAARADRRVPGVRIVASGSSSGTAADIGQETASAQDCLLAFVLHRSCPDDQAFDRRLRIEALPDGWCYSIPGPGMAVTSAFITDAKCLPQAQAHAFAASNLMKSGLLRGTSPAPVPSTLSAVPIPCRWRPFKKADGALRVGDAQATYDPIAGRGVQEAVFMADRLVRYLADGVGDLEDMQSESYIAYGAYLRRKVGFYADGFERFGTDFWRRRLDGAARVAH